MSYLKFRDLVKVKGKPPVKKIEKKAAFRLDGDFTMLKRGKRIYRRVEE